MSKLMFYGHEYSFKELFDLHLKSHLHKVGEVVDVEDGESFDIKDIHMYREKYFNEVITKKHKENIIIKIDEKTNLENLKNKYNQNTISKEELMILINCINKDESFKVKYNKFFIVNMSKAKPSGLSFTDFGRFYEMIKFMSYKNKMETCCGKSIKLSDLTKYLEFNNDRTCSNFLSKLKKFNLIADIKTGGIKFLAVNPAYAQRNMRVNKDIFKLFKDDLKDFFSEYEIMYLEMEDDGVDIDSLILIE